MTVSKISMKTKIIILMPLITGPQSSTDISVNESQILLK